MAMTAEKSMLREVCCMTFAPVRVSTLLLTAVVFVLAPYLATSNGAEAGPEQKKLSAEVSSAETGGSTCGQELYHRSAEEQLQEGEGDFKLPV
jgi:hypothetical protein